MAVVVLVFFVVAYPGGSLSIEHQTFNAVEMVADDADLDLELVGIGWDYGFNDEPSVVMVRTRVHPPGGTRGRRIGVLDGPARDKKDVLGRERVPVKHGGRIGDHVEVTAVGKGITERRFITGDPRSIERGDSHSFRAKTSMGLHEIQGKRIERITAGRDFPTRTVNHFLN